MCVECIYVYFNNPYLMCIIIIKIISLNVYTYTMYK